LVKLEIEPLLWLRGIMDKKGENAIVILFVGLSAKILCVSWFSNCWTHELDFWVMCLCVKRYSERIDSSKELSGLGKTKTK
jgi:hypothetical protein